jgi:hypothetical protein
VAARTGCSRTARCSTPHSLLVHQNDAHGPCEGAKRVSLAGGLLAATNCPERLTAYRKLSGGTGQRKGARAAGTQRRWRVVRGAAAAKKRGVGSLGVRVNRAADSRGPLGPVLIRTRRPSRRVWARGPGQRVAQLGVAQRRGPKGAAARATASGQEDGPAGTNRGGREGGRNA